MRRRGRPGLPRWVMGGLAAAVVFAMSSVVVGFFASANTTSQVSRPSTQAAQATQVCLPVIGCGTPTPVITLPPTPVITLPPLITLPPTPTPPASPPPTSVPTPPPVCSPLPTCLI